MAKSPIINPRTGLTFSGAVGSVWRRSNAATRTVAMVGDSTTDITAAGSGFFTRLAQHGQPGGLLEGVTFLDFGSNGRTLASWLAGGGTAGKTFADLPAGLGALGLRMGINDVRQGATTEDQLTARVIGWIDLVSPKYPNAVIFLEVPNSLTLDDVGANGYVTTTGIWAGMTVAQAAQAASTLMRNAYYRAVAARPYVVLMDAQDMIFGRVSVNKAVSTGSNQHLTPLMSDQLHPTDAANFLRADWYAKVFSIRPEVSAFALTAEFAAQMRSDAAHYANFPDPHAIFPSAVLDTRYWQVWSLGRVIASGTNYADFSFSNWPSGFGSAYNLGIQYSPGDLVLIDNSQILGNLSFQSARSPLRALPLGASWSAVGQVQPVVGQAAYLCRSKFARAGTAWGYVQDPTFTFQKPGYISSKAADGSYIRITAYPNQGNAKDWAVLTTDVMVAYRSIWTSALTGIAISASGNDLLLTGSAGTFSALFNAMPVVLFGQH